MSQHEAIDGVVVRVRDMGDCNRYLQVLTAERGRITLLAKGSHSMRSPQAAVSQLYTYANFEYYRKGSVNILKGGSSIRPFYALSEDIDRLNLASYLCDVICDVTDEGVEASELLRLLLNSLYAVSEELRPQELIKGAFELRVAAMSGYEPALSCCTACGTGAAELFYLDVMNGALVCDACHGKRQRLPTPQHEDLREAEIIGILSASVREAFRYCVGAPLERLFSFELKEAEDLRGFSKLAETYLLSHLGHGFDSLNFYHTMKNTPAVFDINKKDLK
ncbi:MAG: DNA repair protein RecO [Ruminococcaceae bacterium]|nr:DNA repair protein RecO [Oscillospiraceae bacterium]